MIKRGIQRKEQHSKTTPKTTSPHSTAQTLPIGQSQVLQLQKRYGNQTTSKLLRSASHQALQTKRAAQFQLASLKSGTAVRVYDTDSEWFGTVKSYDESSATYTIVQDKTDNEVQVHRNQVGYHPQDVETGNIPEQAGKYLAPTLKYPTNPEMEKQRYLYHVTAASNLLAIVKSDGLIPKRKRPEQQDGFKGLDDMRSGKQVDPIPNRLAAIEKTRNDLATDTTMSPQLVSGLLGDTDKQEADTMLGTKDEFNFATPSMESILDYSTQIFGAQEQSNKKNVIFRFQKGVANTTWYQDLQGVSDIRTLSKIPKDAMEVAFVPEHDTSIETEDFENGLEWEKLADLDELEIRFKLLM